MKKKAFRAALPYTLPICVGFLLIGASYGLLMRSKGFSVWYPMAMSALIYAGSMEFVTVNLLLSAFRPLYAFLLTLMVNARHLFYGISMLQKYEGLGWKRLYLIYGMCDESFSINCTVTPPEGVDRGWFMFFVTLLNQIYWVSGATLGALLGLVLHFNTEGIEFIMTALFVVMFLDQWEKAKDHRPALIGVGCSAACLLAFGGQSFIIPAMALIVLSFTLGRSRLERGGRHDPDAADYHDRRGRARYDGHAVPAVSHLPAGEDAAEVRAVPRNGTADGSDRITGGIRSEGRTGERNTRPARGHRHRGDLCAAQVEEEHAAEHWRRDAGVYAAGAVGVLRNVWFYIGETELVSSAFFSVWRGMGN